MSTEPNIWKHPDGSLPEEKLYAYLEGTLPETERWEVEQWLGEGGAEADAIEGLSTLSAGDAQKAKRHINSRLQQSLSRKRPRRRFLDNQKEVWIIVLVVLLLTILCFGVMWHINHR